VAVEPFEAVFLSTRMVKGAMVRDKLCSDSLGPVT